MIKVSAIETTVTYEVNDISFYSHMGGVMAITKEFTIKASTTNLISIVPATDTKWYSDNITECVKYGKVITVEEFESGLAAVIENARAKVAFIKEALFSESVGAMAD